MKTLIKSSLVAFAVITSNISLANNVSPEFLINEIDTVYKQYLHGSPEVSTYALESFVRLLESDQSTELLQKTGPSNLAFSYIRLGFLYEKSGLKQKAAKVFSKGVASYKSPHNKDVAVTLSELKSVVNQLDAKTANK